jgi:hypothetical protein
MAKFFWVRVNAVQGEKIGNLNTQAVMECRVKTSRLHNSNSHIFDKLSWKKLKPVAFKMGG